MTYSKYKIKSLEGRNKKIKILYKQGLALRAIAALFNISHESVRTIVRKKI